MGPLSYGKLSRLMSVEYTSATADMTGFDSVRRTHERREVEPGHNRGLGSPGRALLSFQRPLRRARRGSPSERRRRFGSDQRSIARSRSQFACKPDAPRAWSSVAGAAGHASPLRHRGAAKRRLPTWSTRRRRRRPAGRAVGRHRLAVDLTPPWRDQPPRLARGDPERAREQRRAGAPVPPSQPSSTTSGISSGTSRAHVDRSKRASAASAASVAVEALDELARQRALRLVRRAPSDRARAPSSSR